MTTSAEINPQTARAETILANLATDGRFEGRLWTAGDKCRIYVGSYGYLAIVPDGRVFANLTRLRGNISSAAGL